MEQQLKCFCVGMQSPEVKQTAVKTIADVQGPLNKFPDFFCMGTFIDSTHMKL